MLTRLVTHTQFETVIVPATANLAGLAAGQGKCIAVHVKVNQTVRNQTGALPLANRMIYIGDKTRQEWEIIGSTAPTYEAPMIIEDLSELYLRRNPAATETIAVQLMIYLGDGDQITINPVLRG